MQPMSPIELDQLLEPGTTGRRIFDRMVELTIQPHEPGDRPAMPAEQLLRVLTGQRNISSLEIALVAENLQTDVLALLGAQDPHPVTIIGPCAMPERADDAPEQHQDTASLSLDWRYLVQDRSNSSSLPAQRIARVRRGESGAIQVTMFKGTPLSTDQMRSIADFVDALDADDVQP